MSPELAAIVVESDRTKESLANHFHPSIIERLRFYEIEMEMKERRRKGKYHPNNCMTKMTGMKDSTPTRQQPLCETINSGWLNESNHQIAFCLPMTNGLLDREKLKMTVLLQQYGRTLMRLQDENVVRYSDKTKEGEKIEEKEKSIGSNWRVELGQKSTVFSIGLILVELFGGLRTGLTGLCHFPVITSWFSKEHAYDSIEMEYSRRLELYQQQYSEEDIKIPATNFPTYQNDENMGIQTTSSMCHEQSATLRSSHHQEHRSAFPNIDVPNINVPDQENVWNDEMFDIPSLTPFSGSSDRRVDCEFRVALEWESKSIPLITSKSTTRSSTFDMETLKETLESGNTGQQQTTDSIMKSKESVLYHDHESRLLTRRRLSIVEPTPSTIAQTSSKTSSPSSSSSSLDRRCNIKRVQREKNFVRENRKERMRDGGDVVRMKSFKDLYKEYCYPMDGCLSLSWVSEHVDGKNRLRLPIGCLVGRVLDECLQENPTKRPSYAVLKRMLHGLKLICWNDQFISTAWKTAGGHDLGELSIHVDAFGYVEIREEKSGKALLKTISRRGDDDDVWELVLETEF